MFISLSLHLYILWILEFKYILLLLLLLVTRSTLCMVRQPALSITTIYRVPNNQHTYTIWNHKVQKCLCQTIMISDRLSLSKVNSTVYYCRYGNNVIRIVEMQHAGTWHMHRRLVGSLITPCNCKWNWVCAWGGGGEGCGACNFRAILCPWS